MITSMAVVYRLIPVQVGALIAVMTVVVIGAVVSRRLMSPPRASETESKDKFGHLSRDWPLVVSRLWSNMLGLVSVLLVAYFWVALLTRRAWQPIFPGAGLVVVAALALSILMSAIAGRVGSRRWYFATVAALVAFLFFALRMH
jgi:uncharacterized BrkB/YihY/UPF0761 family membrane protein